MQPQPAQAPARALVFHHFGPGSYLTRLGQDLGVPIRLIFGTYADVTLLRAEDHPDAARSGPPTVDAFLDTLQRPDPEGRPLDVFVFAHGSPGAFATVEGEVNAASLRRLGPVPGLRAVYQMNCHGATLNEVWRALGAECSVGPAGVNFYPLHWPGFIRSWADGAPWAKACANGRAGLALGPRTTSQAYILGDALARLSSWGGTIAEAPGVLGATNAARRYFARCWGIRVKSSGRTAMEESSAMVIAGDRDLRLR